MGSGDMVMRADDFIKAREAVDCGWSFCIVLAGSHAY